MAKDREADQLFDACLQGVKCKARTSDGDSYSIFVAKSDFGPLNESFVQHSRVRLAFAENPHCSDAFDVVCEHIMEQLDKPIEIKAIRVRS
jgi:hypothetical protein